MMERLTTVGVEQLKKDDRLLIHAGQVEGLARGAYVVHHIIHWPDRVTIRLRAEKTGKVYRTELPLYRYRAAPTSSSQPERAPTSSSQPKRDPTLEESLEAQRAREASREAMERATRAYKCEQEGHDWEVSVISDWVECQRCRGARRPITERERFERDRAQRAAQAIALYGAEKAKLGPARAIRRRPVSAQFERLRLIRLRPVEENEASSSYWHRAGLRGDYQ